MSLNKSCLGKFSAILNYLTIMIVCADTVARFAIMFGAWSGGNYSTTEVAASTTVAAQMTLAQVTAKMLQTETSTRPEDPFFYIMTIYLIPFVALMIMAEL